MARIDYGIMGGFSGRVGPVVGFERFGRWYMRTKPRMVHNPRTEAQQEHRAMFKQEVQLAAQMRWAVNLGMKGVAHQMGLTAQNLFVKANQQAFSMAEGLLQVDYPALQVSQGPVAPVAITDATVDEAGVLTVHFEKNPEHRAASAYDSVYLWIYSPATGKGYLTNAVYRRAKRFGVLLPVWLGDGELHLYAFVQDEEGRCSATAYGSTAYGSVGELDEFGELTMAPEEDQDGIINSLNSRNSHNTSTNHSATNNALTKCFITSKSQ